MAGKAKKRLRNGLIATGATGMLYFASPKLGYVTHKIKQDISDTLGERKLLADKETNDIINLMAGKITKEEFIGLLSRHGQTVNPDDVDFEQISKFDPALYNTILELQTKYGNPTISFSGSHFNPEAMENEPNRARHNPLNNQINIHQLDSLMIRFKDLGDDKDITRMIQGIGVLSYSSRRTYLLNSWIAELCHAKQLTEKGVLRYCIDNTIDYMKTPLNYEKQYKMKGTNEYEAHSIYEPQIIEDFINTYIKYSKNTENNDFKLAKFYGGLFNKYKDIDKATLHLEQGAAKGDSLSSYVLARYYFDFAIKYYNYNFDNDSGKIPTELINGKEYSIDEIFGLTMKYYEQAYRQGLLIAGKEIIYICNHYNYGKHDDFVLKLGEEIIKTRPKDLDDKDVAQVYHELSSIYFNKQEYKKAEAYENKAHQLGYRYEEIF